MQNLEQVKSESRKLVDAINAAYKEMVVEKMLLGRDIVTADNDGNIRIESARDHYNRVYK